MEAHAAQRGVAAVGTSPAPRATAWAEVDDVGADADEAVDAGARGPLEHGERSLSPLPALAASEILLLHVAVGVEPTAHPLRRGKRGSPFTTGTPPGYAPQAAVAGEPGRRRVALDADPPPDLRRRGGHGRGDQDGHDPQHLEGVAQHGVDRGPGSIFQGSVASSSALVAPMSRQVASRASWGAQRAQASRWLGQHLGRARAERAVRVGGRPDPAALGVDDGRHPGDQVAQVVGQVGVVARHDPLVGEVAVSSERHVAEQVVAQGVDPELVGQGQRGDFGDLERRRASSPSPGDAGLDHRLPELLPAHEEIPVDEDLLRAGRSRPPCTWRATTRSGTSRCPCRSDGAPPPTAMRTARDRCRRTPP